VVDVQGDVASGLGQPDGDPGTDRSPGERDHGDVIVGTAGTPRNDRDDLLDGRRGAAERNAGLLLAGGRVARGRDSQHG
jgi:hypothetical protein